MGLSGLLLPPALALGGLAAGVPVQDDISSYYHTPLRDVLVGTLCATGVFLYCYRGYDRVENWTANAGCLAALGVAFFPIDVDSEPPYQRTVSGLVHTFCGGAFFLTLACYSLVHFPRSSGPGAANPGDARARRRAWVYRASGAAILAATAAMGAYLFLLPHDLRRACDRWNALFFLEGAAAWAFAAAWLTKGHALAAEIALDLMGLAESRLPPRLRPGAGGAKPAGNQPAGP